MLKRAALLQLDLLLDALGRGVDPQGRHALQRPVERLTSGLHRRRLVRALPRWVAVGGLPSVLRAPALPADAGGVEGRPVPALAPGSAGRHLAERDAQPALASRPFPQGRDHPRRAARAAGAAVRGASRRGEGGARACRVPQGADRRERAQAAQARRRPRVARGQRGVGRLFADPELQRPGRGAEGLVRARGGAVGGAAARLGSRLQRRHATRRCARARARTWSRRTPTTTSSTGSPASRTSGSCHSWSTSRIRRRPWAGAVPSASTCPRAASPTSRWRWRSSITSPSLATSRSWSCSTGLRLSRARS